MQGENAEAYRSSWLDSFSRVADVNELKFTSHTLNNMGAALHIGHSAGVLPVADCFLTLGPLGRA